MASEVDRFIKEIFDIYQRDPRYAGKLPSTIDSLIGVFTSKLTDQINKVDSTSFDLNKLFNVDSKDIPTNQYKSLTKQILRTIETGIKSNKLELTFKKFDISKLFNIDATKLNTYTTQYNKIIQNTLDRLQDSLSNKNLKLDFKKFNISTLFNSGEKFNLETRKQYQSLVRSLLANIERSLPTKFDIATRISLRSLLDVGSKGPVKANFEFTNLQRTLFNKVRDAVEKTTFQPEQRVSVISLLQSPTNKDFTWRLQKKYNALLNSLLSKVNKAVSSRDFSFRVEKDISVTSLLNNNPTLTDSVTSKFNSLIKLVLSKVTKAVKNVQFDIDEHLNIFDIFNFKDGGFKLITRIQYQLAVSKLLGKVNRFISQINFGDTKMSIFDVLHLPKFTTKSTNSNTYHTLKKEENVFHVIVDDLNTKALRKLQVFFSNSRNILPSSSKTITESEAASRGGGILATILKSVAGLGLMGVGVSTMLKAFFDNGPLKGTEKVIGRVMYMIGKKLSSGLIKWVTKLPIAKEIAHFLNPARMLRPFYKEIQKVVFEGLFKLAGTSIGRKIVSKVGVEGFVKLAPKLLKFLKPIPGVGLLLGLGFGMQRLNRGDLLGGLLEIGSGIASIFPGAGTAISLVLDGINAYRDLTGKTEKFNKNIIFDTLKKAGKGIANMVFDYIPGWVKKFISYDKESGQITVVGKKFQVFSKEDKSVQYEPDPNVASGHKPMAHDFIWRQGAKEPMRFDSSDTVISSKSGGGLDKNIEAMVKTLNNLSDSYNELLQKVDDLIAVTPNGSSAIVSATVNSSKQQVVSDNSSFSSDDIRDPAYKFRQDVWKKIRS